MGDKGKNLENFLVQVKNILDILPPRQTQTFTSLTYMYTCAYVHVHSRECRAHMYTQDGSIQWVDFVSLLFW